MPSFAAVVDALNMAAAIVGAAFAVFVVIGISAIFYRDYKSSPAPVEINKRPGALRSHDFDAAVAALGSLPTAPYSPLRCSPIHTTIAASFDNITVKDSRSRLPTRSPISNIDATPIFEKLSIKESLPAPRFPRRKAVNITARLETFTVNDFGPRSIPVTSAVDVEIEMSDAPAATTPTADITPDLQRLTIAEPAPRSRSRKSAPASRYQRSATTVDVLPPTFTNAFEGLQVKPKSCLKAASRELPVKPKFPFVPLRFAEPVKEKKRVHFQFFSGEDANKEDGVIVSELHYFESYNDTSFWSDARWRHKLARKYAKGRHVPHTGRRRMQLVINGKLRLCKESGGFLTTEPIQYDNFVRPRCGYTRRVENDELHPEHDQHIIEHELRWSKSFRAHCPACGRG